MQQRSKLLLVFVSLLLAPTTKAQDNATHYAQLQKDAQVAQAYTFTMDTLSRTLIAGNEMELAMKTDDSLTAMNAARGKGVFATLDQLTAAYSASPKLIEISTSHGFTPRSLAVALWSYSGTLMSISAVSQGRSADDLRGPFRPNSANMKFFVDHKEELKPLLQNYPVHLKVLLPFEPH